VPNKYQIQANEIIGRPLDAEFWKHTAAKTIVEMYDRLEVYMGHESAADTIVSIWNAACEEYGE